MRHWICVDFNGNNWLYSGNVTPIYDESSGMWETSEDEEGDFAWTDLVEHGIIYFLDTNIPKIKEVKIKFKNV